MTRKRQSDNGRSARLAAAVAHAQFDRLQQLIGESPVVVFLWRMAPGWPVEYVSPNVAQFGYSVEECQCGETSWSQAAHPDDAPHVEAETERFLREGRREFMQTYRIRTKSGEVRWIEDRTHVVYDSDGQVTHLLGCILDVTVHKQTELALRRRNEQLEILRQIDRDILEVRPVPEIAGAALRRLRQVVPCSRISVSLLDLTRRSSELIALDTDIPTEVRPGAAFPLASLRRAITQLRHQRMLRTVPGDDMVKIIPPLALMWQEGMQCFLGLPLRFRGQLIGIMNLYARHKEAFNDEETETAREVADRLAIAVKNVQLLESVREQSERLRVLRSRLAAAEEAERRKLAMDLHDQVGASLSALGLNLTVLREHSGANLDREEAANLKQAVDQVEQITAHVRNVMADLRPPVLDDYGLVAALRWFAGEYRDRTGIAVQVRGQEPRNRLPRETEVSLFRVAQEALTNVAKHSHASQVQVRVTVNHGTVCLKIADNGRGFAAQRLPSPRKDSGWGMLVMRERVEVAGGTLQVTSGRDKGTTITATVPRRLR